jgi:uncharacterized protein DUF3618
VSERSAKQIKREMERTRAELSGDVAALRAKLGALTDWRRQATEHRNELLAAGAATGALLATWTALKRR